MNSRHKLASLKSEATPLLELVTNDINLESIWLSTMATLEDIAAKYILSNVTAATPTETLREIIEHVKDEQRHGRLLLEMRPTTLYPDNKYYLIEKEWQKIGQEFIMAFFNSPLLREADHRHAAYVHGAQTIERFPFRIYTLYLSMSKLPKVKSMLPGIIADEYGHLELGKKMYKELSPNERMPLTKLYQLEEQLCLIMIKRMNLALRQKFNLYQPDFSSELELKITQNSEFETAWNYALSCGERYFSATRADCLKEANTLARLAFRTNQSYRDIEKSLESSVKKYIFQSLEAGLSEITIQNRFDSHYESMIYHTNNIPLHHSYFRILENHPAENATLDEKRLEEKLWAELITEIIQVDQNEDSLSISRA